MGLDDEIRERFKDASDKLAEEVASLAGQVADKAAPSLFRFMRKHKPIVATPSPASRASTMRRFIRPTWIGAARWPLTLLSPTSTSARATPPRRGSASWPRG